ncbi:MAG: DUF4363 family protein [Oscillospiraceae bacterium]|nr:DUF4363 family protein [Oscillospiraceae bacterium]
MKKEVLAIILLGAIGILSVWNLRHLDRLTAPLLALTEEAFLAAQAGNKAEAAEKALLAEEAWLDAGAYTHVFLRHPEVDAATDAFCSFRGAIVGGDPGEIYGAYLSLRMRISGIREMEQLRLGCIF